MTAINRKPTVREQLTEQTIQKRLNHFFASWKYNVDGLYVFSWESDKLIWTKAGYIYEFEIKISRSDFKADFKHKKEKHIVLASTIARDKARELQLSLFEQKEQQHPQWTRADLERMYGDIDKMAEGKRMPNYFYYAVPEGMIQPDEVPPYAGLIYIKEEYVYAPQSFIIAKEAPRLHKTKYTDGELNLGEKFYYNMKSWQRRHKEQVDYSLMYRSRLQDELASSGRERSYKELEDELHDANFRLQLQKDTADRLATDLRHKREDCDLYQIEQRLMFDRLRRTDPDFRPDDMRRQALDAYYERYPGRRPKEKE